MHYRGVPAPVMKTLVREVLAKHAPSCEERFAAARELFFGARFREERYVALGLTDRKECQSLDVLPLYEQMIVEGAWWDIVEPNAADKDFFIRKAIGWALRQYAWTDPDEVKRYVAKNRDRLSGLSVREALKNVGGGRGAKRRAARGR